MQRMSESIKAAANAYWKIGANVIPCKGKKPLIEWAKYQTQRQTREEFDSFSWNDADGFSLICGTELDDKTFFGIVDFDIKNLPNETIEKGRQVLSHLRLTKVELTPSGGEHWIFLCRVQPDSKSVYHNVCGLEIIGRGKYAVCAPSQNYTTMNDNTFTTIENLETLVIGAMQQAGIQTQQEKEKHVWFDREDLAGKAYTGKNPACIHELLKGAAEGQRNEYAIRLSSYYVNFCRVESTKAQKKLKEWNTQTNTPPLDNDELKAIFDSATKGRYVFGCDDNILKSFCNENVDCPLRKKTDKTETPTTVFDAETEEQIRLEVQRVLDADNQLDALKPHLDTMAIGEDNTKKTLCVLLLSSKEKNAESKQIIILKAESGAGKSTLIRKLIAGYKVKEVGRFSEHALDYSNLSEFDILVLKELGSMDEEKQGVSTIKFLSSDDRGYTVEITSKNAETGKFQTEQYKIPAITVVSSTTRLILDAQFERRSWPLGLDESQQQTERIKSWKSQMELQNAEKLLSLRRVTDYEFSTEVYRRFIEKYEPKTVIIPFPKQLLDVLGVEVLRVRGDFDKLLNFTKFYATLNLKRLQEIKENVYVLSPEVAIEGLRIALEPLSTMLSRVDKRARAVFDALKKTVDVEMVHADKGGQTEKEIRYDHKNAKIDKKTRELIAVSIGKSEKTVRNFFSELENAGYVSGDGKKPKTFTLLYDVVEIEKKVSGIADKLKSDDNLITEMTNAAQEWSKSGLEILFLRKGSIKSEDVNQDTKILVLSTEEKISNPSLILNQPALAESDPDNRPNNKQQDAQDDKGQEYTAPHTPHMIPCPICAARKKDLFFESDLDLKTHIDKCHNQTSYPEPGE